MIVSFKVENFCSIGKMQEVSFAIPQEDHLDDSSTKIGDKYLNNVACLLGHSGSGKTNILKAMTLLFRFMQGGHAKQLVFIDDFIKKHQLSKNKNSYFEIEFINNKKLYKYSVKLNKEYVVHEYLGIHREGEYSKLFELKRGTNKKISQLTFEKKSNIKVSKNDMNGFQEKFDVSAFSFLEQAGYTALLGIENIFNHMKSNVTAFGNKKYDYTHSFSVARELSENKGKYDIVLELIKDCDFGLSGFGFEEKMGDTIMFCKYQRNGRSLSLPLFEESIGTRNAIYLINDLLYVLATGGIAIIDEIEPSIHPYVVKKIIAVFEDKRVNKSNAQLIFSTHQPWFLQDRTKTQIFLTEKNEELETEIFRLDEVEGVRNNENYFIKYLTGAYGAVPNINWF